MSPQPLLIILGPTASGKTKLAVAIAQELNGEIMSADSRQVFKGMDIGTGKDLEEYTIMDQFIPYHLINIKEAGDTYNVNAFKDDFYRAYDQIIRKNKLPILCGGTGMYVHSLLQQHELTAVPPNEELRPKLQSLTKEELIHQLEAFPLVLRSTADYSSTKRIIRAIEIATYLSNNQLENKLRPTLTPLIIGLQSKLEVRRARILERLDFRLKNGLIEEVKKLIKKGVSMEKLIFYGLEYKFVAAHIAGELTLNELTEKLGIAICQFAKRQMTFFRKMEKDGVQIHWLDTDQGMMQLKQTIINLLADKTGSN